MLLLQINIIEHFIKYEERKEGFLKNL